MSGLRLLTSSCLRSAAAASSSRSSFAVASVVPLSSRAAFPSQAVAAASSSVTMSLGLHAKLSLPPASASLRAFSSSVQAAAPAGKRDAHSQSSPADMASNFLDAVLDAGFAKRRVYGQPTPGTPTSGRSVQVQNGDVGRAYRSLMAVLRRDDIRGELRRGERYEKPNQERRRKRSERHRRRFADLVRKKVQLVMALRARGV